MRKISKVNIFKRISLFLMVIGPGFITASADNDAPGIATYSMAGSRYGYSFLWLILIVTLGEVIVQEMAARLGAITGKGTADLIRERFGVKVTLFAMACLLVANFGTTIAQFAGIAAGAELVGISRYIAVPIISLLIGFLVMRGSYVKVEKFLLILCLAALSYVITAFLIKPDWGEIARSVVTPHLIFEPDYILTVLATIGTTITPWGIFYMQASVVDKGVDEEDYPLTRIDIIFGTIWGNIISAFIIICTGAVLYTSGIVVEGAEQAALALAPLAGEWSKVLFTTGMMGASILAAMVLPLSTVYAVTEAFGWERGLDTKKSDAPIFYGLYAIIIILSVVIVMIPGVPLFPIMWLSQTVNAILLPVLLVLLLKLANDHELLGARVNKKAQNFLSIFLTILISLATLTFLISSLLG